jgi:hypothetical protein
LAPSDAALLGCVVVAIWECLMVWFGLAGFLGVRGGSAEHHDHIDPARRGPEINSTPLASPGMVGDLVLTAGNP